MITFNRETGDYSVGFGIPKQKPKSKKETKTAYPRRTGPYFPNPAFSWYCYCL